jgi:hypothetical protein
VIEQVRMLEEADDQIAVEIFRQVVGRILDEGGEGAADIVDGGDLQPSAVTA